MGYDVHLFKTVRIKLTNVPGSTPEEAATNANAALDLHDLLDNPNPRQEDVECIEAEPDETGYFLVDQLDEDGDILQAHWLDSDGSPLVDNKTAVERRSERATEASLFMEELLASVETLAGIVDQFGVRTLADLMYLQAAIVAGEHIDLWADKSSVLEVVRALPSAQRWGQFIRPADERAPNQTPMPRPTAG